MTTPTPPVFGTTLDFNAPLSPARADRLVTMLAAWKPATVLDLGCGGGEFLLRLLTAAPGAQGVGTDERPEAITRARTAARERGLSERVEFVERSVKESESTADLVISIGAYQAFGTAAEALVEVRRRMKPNGRAVFAAEFWERPPTRERLAHMWPGTTVDSCGYLPELVDLAVAAGFRPLDIGTATRVEWEEFESGLALAGEEWLLENGDHPDAEAVRTRLDDNRRHWLRGHREVLGFAYLVLG